MKKIGKRKRRTVTQVFGVTFTDIVGKGRDWTATDTRMKLWVSLQPTGTWLWRVRRDRATKVVAFGFAKHRWRAMMLAVINADRIR